MTASIFVDRAGLLSDALAEAPDLGRDILLSILNAFSSADPDAMVCEWGVLASKREAQRHRGRRT